MTDKFEDDQPILSWGTSEKKMQFYTYTIQDHNSTYGFPLAPGLKINR